MGMDPKELWARANENSPLHRQDDCAVAELQVCAVRADSREADFVFSTSAIDRHGDILEQVWQLDAFKRNPVALFAHNSRELPIGRAKRVAVDSIDGKDALVGTIEFATAEHNPLAEQVFAMVRDGFLKSVSVGFIPHSVRTETVDDRTVFVLSDNELAEISVVPVPANPEALGRIRERALSGQDVGKLAELAATSGAVAPALKELLQVTTGTVITLPNEKDAMAVAKDSNVLNDCDVMDPKELLNERDAAIATRDQAIAERDEARAELDTETERADEAEEARDKAVEAEAKAWSECVERDMLALVGVKITPAEKAGVIALAKADRDAYAQHLEALRGKDDISTASGKRVLGRSDESENPTRAGADDNGQDFADAVEREAGEAA